MTIETKKIKGLTIKFSENDITIIDSYKIKNPDKMLIILKKGLQRNWEFLLYNRIPEYYINKWLTHNSLYRMNIFKKHNSKLKLDKKKHPIKKCFY